MKKKTEGMSSAILWLLTNPNLYDFWLNKLMKMKKNKKIWWVFHSAVCVCFLRVLIIQQILYK